MNYLYLNPYLRSVSQETNAKILQMASLLKEIQEVLGYNYTGVHFLKS